ncbi:MAG: TraR/DksA family transcriptional regulator [bacterium]|nr:TraR/DksA family transcriptional regulator [bacterium]
MSKTRLYSPEDAEHFRQILLKKKEKILRDLGYLEDSTRKMTPTEMAGDNSAYAFHMADQGTDANERDKAILLASREGRYLAKIEAALKRIEDGTYGICTVFNRPIEYARLEAIPTTTKCAEAKLAEKNGEMD